MDKFKNLLIDEWMKENPPFDNDKMPFEDWLVLELKREDANQAIQLDEKQKEIDSLNLQVFDLMQKNANLRSENRDLRNGLISPK